MSKHEQGEDQNLKTTAIKKKNQKTYVNLIKIECPETISL